MVAGGTTSVAAITPGVALPRPSGVFPMLLCTRHCYPPHPSHMLHGLAKPVLLFLGLKVSLLIRGGGLALKNRCFGATQAGCNSPPSCYELAAPGENPHSPSTDGTCLSSPQCTTCAPHKLLAGTSAGCLFLWDLLSGQKRTLHSPWKETLLRPAEPSKHIYNLTFHFFWTQSLCL